MAISGSYDATAKISFSLLLNGGLIVIRKLEGSESANMIFQSPT